MKRPTVPNRHGVDVPAPYYKFSTFPLAFDYCRTVDQPVDVYVWEKGDYRFYRLFPSGSAKRLDEPAD